MSRRSSPPLHLRHPWSYIKTLFFFPTQIRKIELKSEYAIYISNNTTKLKSKEIINNNNNNNTNNNNNNNNNNKKEKKDMGLRFRSLRIFKL